MARRPLADGAALLRAPRAPRRAGAERRELADARARRRRTAGRCCARASSSASRASSPSAWTPPTGPASARAAGSRSRRWAARSSSIAGWLPGKGRRGETIGALLLGVHEPGRRAALRRARRHRLHRRGARAAQAAARAARARGLAVHRRRGAAARGACSASRASSPRSSSPSGHPPATSATPPTRACARTRTRERVVREDPAQGRPPRTPPRAAGETHAARRERQSSRAAKPAPGDSAERAGGDPRRERGRHRGAGQRRDRGRGPRAEALQPRQGALSRGGLHEGRADRLLRRDRAGAAAAPRGPRADRHALAGRRRGEVLLPEAVARRTGPSGSAPRRCPPAASRSTTRSPTTSPTLVWLANLAAIELHTPLALARGDRPARRSMVFDLDPGAPAGRDRVLRGRAAAAGAVRGPRPAELRQDLRLQGPAAVRAAERRGRRLRRHQAVRESRRRAARAERAGPRRLAHDEGAPRPARC